MRILAPFRIALRALRRNKLRTLLTMLGIIIGVTAWIVIREPQRSAPVQSQTQVSLKSLAGRLPSVASVAPTSAGAPAFPGTLSSLPPGVVPSRSIRA